MHKTNESTQPLLQNETASPVKVVAEGTSRSELVFFNLPPQSPTDKQSENPVVRCSVCNAILHAEGKLHLHVIKCHACGEATPIRPPPLFKKYVRCQCNCLLVCRISARRIICPRVNCNRVVSLATATRSLNVFANKPEDQQSLVSYRVFCGHCGFSFISASRAKTFQYCPHCKNRSYTDLGYKKRRLCCVILFLISVSFITAVLCVLTVARWFRNSIAADTVLALFVLFTVAFSIALFYHCSLTISRVEKQTSMQYS